MTGFVVLDRVGWTSPPLAGFRAMVAMIEARFGPPAARDLDSNGLGPFDAFALGFPCGLEVVLWRFQLGTQFEAIDPAVEPSNFEIHANEGDLEHIALHLGIPVDSELWFDREHLLATPAPRAFVVMRVDDNGNRFEVRRVTTRCEANAIARELEARGHKQHYWVAACEG